MFHGFLGERLEDWKSARLMVRRIAENFHLPYFTISPTFTICPVHGYIAGEHFACPHHHEDRRRDEAAIPRITPHVAHLTKGEFRMSTQMR